MRDVLFVQTDRGGPLVCNHESGPELRGIGSWTSFECFTYYPTVYVRIYNNATGTDESNIKEWICKTAPGTSGC